LDFFFLLWELITTGKSLFENIEDLRFRDSWLLFWDIVEVLTVKLVDKIIIVVDVFDSGCRRFNLLRGRNMECGRALPLGEEKLFTFCLHNISYLLPQYRIFIEVIGINVLLK
jgi:hypothetical protein